MREREEKKRKIKSEKKRKKRKIQAAEERKKIQIQAAHSIIHSFDENCSISSHRSNKSVVSAHTDNMRRLFLNLIQNTIHFGIKFVIGQDYLIKKSECIKYCTIKKI